MNSNIVNTDLLYTAPVDAKAAMNVQSISDFHGNNDELSVFKIDYKKKMNSNPKIIIVDDHSLFRETMKLLIETEGMGEVIAEAKNGKEFLDLLDVHMPDLVLMDIEMPEMDGLEATFKALKIRPYLKILVLTMYGQKDDFVQMINAGAMGFVLKSSGKEELEKAIKTVIGGNCYFSNEVLRKIKNSSII